MHQLPLLINIAVALVAAFFGGLIVRRIGLPSLIGYMLSGVAIGPFTPGFVGDIATLSQLAELGVIFLMFGVGLHFSRKVQADAEHEKDNAKLRQLAEGRDIADETGGERSDCHAR